MGERLMPMLRRPGTGFAIAAALFLTGCWLVGKPSPPLTAQQAAQITHAALQERERNELPNLISSLNHAIERASREGSRFRDTYTGGMLSPEAQAALRKHFTDRGFECDETNKEGGFHIKW